MPRSRKGTYSPAPSPTSLLGKVQTGKQNDRGPGTFGTDTFLYANGGSLDNPMGFPGYGYGYMGTYPTYRWMRKHPINRLARAIAVGIVLSSSWEFSKAPNADVPDSWLNDIQANFNDLRVDLVNEFFVNARDFGWYGGEPVWRYSKGQYWLDRVKPLLPDITTILQDDAGDFVGLKNSRKRDGADEDPKLAAPYKAWKYTYQGEAGYHYGESWLEGQRDTAWKDWLDCMQQLQKIGSKIAGMVTIITSPAGTFAGPDGKRISYKVEAEKAIKAMQRGAAGLWWPSLALSPGGRGAENLDAMKVIAELAGKSLNNIQVIDFSGNSSAIAPILDRMKHAEELMFASAKRPSRTGLEGKHGTKEEAGVFTDTGTIDAENEDEHFAVKGVQTLVDAHLMLNRGDDAKGAIRCTPPSVIDRKTQMIKTFMLSLMNQPEIAREYARTLDFKKANSVLDVPTKGEYDPANVAKEVSANKPAPQEGKQPTKKNGKKQNKRPRNVEPQGGRPNKE